MYDGGEPEEDGTADILWVVDRLEELVGMGRRLPFTGRVMVEEEEFLALVDQLRNTVPNEIKQAQRVIKERERVIGEAQEEATKILKAARDKSQYVVSEQGLLNEARQQGEEILRQAEERRKRSMGEIDVYALQQFAKVEAAMQEGLEIIEAAIKDTIDALDQAKSHVAS